VLAVDTDLVVRYLTGDDPQQFDRAMAVIEQAEIFVCLTVLLETEWVLRSVYRYRSTQVIHALRSFAGLPGVRVEDAARATLALEWAERGVDFADALQLAAARGCEAFITFDQRFAAAVAPFSDIAVRAP